MKIIIIAILIISQVGCSSLIYSSGKRLPAIRAGEVSSVSREEIRHKFGEPERIDFETGFECDVFIVKGMVPDDIMAEVSGQLAVLSLCITEIYFFPKSLYDLPGRMKDRHVLRVYYSPIHEGYVRRTSIQKKDRHNQELEPTSLDADQ